MHRAEARLSEAGSRSRTASTRASATSTRTRWRWAAVDEALRNVVAVGADLDAHRDPRQLLLGPTATSPSRLGALVRAAEGCRDAALAFGTPFVSGKDSLNNEFRTEDGHRDRRPAHAPDHARMGVIDDVRKTVTMDLKRAGDLVYVVGETLDECGGSRWYRILQGLLGTQRARGRGTRRDDARRPCPRPSRLGLVRAAHDLSEGGLAVAAAEMAFAGDLGLDLDLGKVPGPVRRSDRLLFSESHHALPGGGRLRAGSRVRAAHGRRGRARRRRSGRVTEAPRLTIRSVGGDRDVIAASIKELRTAWREALPFAQEEAR